MTTTIETTNPGEFQGYPIDLLRGLKGMGKALIGDDALFDAVVAYNASEVEGGVGALGPALRTSDATIVVRSITAHEAPVIAPPVVSAPEVPETWDTYELDELIAKAQQHGVVLPRVKSHGKVVQLLVAAGVTP